MLTNEVGPGRIFVRIREWTGIEHDAEGEITIVKNDYTPLFCTLCTSIWAGMVVGFLRPSIRRAIAISGAANLIEKAVSD